MVVSQNSHGCSGEAGVRTDQCSCFVCCAAKGARTRQCACSDGCYCFVLQGLKGWSRRLGRASTLTSVLVFVQQSSHGRSHEAVASVRTRCCCFASQSSHEHLNEAETHVRTDVCSCFVIQSSHGRSDEAVAAEALANHMRHNNSFVYDLFQAVRTVLLLTTKRIWGGGVTV